ncbi:MAG: dockerin type I domain-containing protein [Candidatus Woesebacteria bacterium]
MRRLIILFIVVCTLLGIGVSVSRAVTADQICKADINQDGTVNLSDYTTLIANFLKTPLTNSRADITGDGAVNLSDYSILVGSFLLTCTPSTPAATTKPPVTGAGHYYVSPTGNDSNVGTAAAPFKTIQKAVNITKSDSSTGATIHVLPGTYRETVTLDSVKGSSSEPVTIVAENGQNTVYIQGSQVSSALSWSKGTDGLSFPSGASSHIYVADASSFGATPELAYNATGTVTRLPKAHEPDWNVTTEWKYHENWWKADGPEGSSQNTLIDTTTDPSGSYPQASELSGNLKNINGFTGSFLTGARLFFKDSDTGHDTYSVPITGHDAGSGKITLEKSFAYNGKPAVGAQTKYFVEGAPQLLDTPGEWYYNPSSKKLYIWPPSDTNPASLKLEFATRMNAFAITKSAYVTLKNLNLQYTNYGYGLSTGPEGAIRFSGFDDSQTNHITLDGLHILHNGVGLRLYQSNGSTTSTGSLSFVTIKDTVVDDSDGYSLMAWHGPVPAPTAFIHNLWIENSEFGHAGYRGSGFGIFMQHTEKIVFINNYLHNSAHNAFELQTGKSSGNTMLLAMNNLSENNCYNGSDCGAFKIYDPSDGNGGRNILIMNNIFRGTKGWSYANEGKGKGNTFQGIGYEGSGYYSDGSKSSSSGICGVTLYRNLIYGNSEGGVHLTSSRDQCLFNNVIAQNGHGIVMNNYSPYTDGSFSNKVIGNLLFLAEPSNPTNFKSYGITSRINKADEGKLTVDKNVYQITGSNSFDMFRQELSYSGSMTWKTAQNIKDNSLFEDGGKDVSGASFSIGNPTKYDVSSTEKLFGVSSVSEPSEVQTIIDALQKEFGRAISNNTTVGRL